MVGWCTNLSCYLYASAGVNQKLNILSAILRNLGRDLAGGQSSLSHWSVIFHISSILMKYVQHSLTHSLTPHSLISNIFCKTTSTFDMFRTLQERNPWGLSSLCLVFIGQWDVPAPVKGWEQCSLMSNRGGEYCSQYFCYLSFSLLFTTKQLLLFDKLIKALQWFQMK